jgi:hypothetical protein
LRPGVLSVAACCYICARILLYMCPHAALYVSACCSIGIGARGARRGRLHLAPRRSICGRMLLYMCPHIALYVSAYCAIGIGARGARRGRLVLTPRRSTCLPYALCLHIYLKPYAYISAARTARPLGSYAQARHMYSSMRTRIDVTIYTIYMRPLGS